MDTTAYNLMHDILELRGIRILFFERPYTNVERVDFGLKKTLYTNYSYASFAEGLYNFHNSTLYRMQDPFHLHYFFWKDFEKKDTDTGAYLIGPFLLESDPIDVDFIIRVNHLPLYTHAVLEEFYHGIPVIREHDSFEAEIGVLLKYCYPTHKYDLNTEEMIYHYAEISNTQPNLSPSESLPMSLVEKRYRDEACLLSAIEHGNQSDAVKYAQILSSQNISDRNTDSFRNYKNYMIAHNSLFRKSVQNANVHPAYIDKLSDSFARKIEASQTRLELTRIYSDMIRKYCLLVQNHSLGGYSQIVRDALNYIDLNLEKALGLKEIAAHIKVNPSYLSAQFKREKHETITNYVNEQRIENSLLLLITTDLQIQKIAEKVGIYDENYFSRLFKKKYNMTAREYRKMIQRKND